MKNSESLKRALIFAGAGASYAVDKDAYPTTVQFFERLPDAIKGHKLISAILHHLPEKFGSGSPDVEKILWCLQELQDYLIQLEDSRNPVSWFIPNNELPGLVGTSHPVSHYAAAARDGRKVIAKLLNEISAKVYEFYSSLPSQENCNQNWQMLFNLLAEKEYWPDAFTTNYDLVIEQAAEFAGQSINYGRGRGIVAALDKDIWKNSLSDPKYLPTDGTGLLTKLHGSVNWLKEGEKIIFGGTGYKGSHAYHAVVYPGFKGVPKDEPFSLFHSYFEAAIQRTEAIILIGFAFRDEYINTCLERNLGSKLINVIDPSDVAVPPVLADRLRHIKNGFGPEAIEELRTYV